MHGLFGRVLHVDVTSGQSAYRDVEESRLRKYLGGVGLGTTLLYEYAPAGVDPLSPANPLIFASAPLVGTAVTTTGRRTHRVHDSARGGAGATACGSATPSAAPLCETPEIFGRPQILA